MAFEADLKVQLLPAERQEKKKEGDCSVHIPEENQNQNQEPGGKYIFRVNAALTKSNPDAYKPKLISIGPYHMQDPELNKDNVKLSFKNSLCQKIDKFEESSRDILNAKLKDSRSCYNNDIPDMKDEEFVDMLLLDGCFILEFMEKYSNKVADDGCERTKVQTLIDMTLLENQIPFFVLFELFKLKHNNANKDDGVLLQDLIVLVRKCIGTQVPKLPPSNVKAAHDYKPLPKHLVEVVHNLCIPRNAKCGRHLNRNDSMGIIEKMNSAEVLAKEGVGFKKIGKVYERYFEMEDGVKTFNATDSTTLFDLYFSNWVLKIPSFKIDGHTETLLRNMIAYEQQSTYAAPVWFSDYVSFMDKLIKSAQDVTLLCRRGIIVNCTDSNDEDEVLTKMFSSLCQNVKTYNTFSGVIRKINLHHDNAWSMWCGRLKQDLVYRPWKPISTVVGGLIVAVGAVVSFKNLFR